MKNVHYMPDDSLLNRLNSNGWNLISDVVYLSFDVAETLFKLTYTTALDACSYVGIDSGASPLSISIFFDILLACCKSITREDYINGSFKTNHKTPQNKLAILKQVRLILWHHMQKFNIINVTLSNNVKQIYMSSGTFEHRRDIFNLIERSSNDATCRSLVENRFKLYELNESDVRHLNTLCSNNSFSMKSKDENNNNNSSHLKLINCNIEDSHINYDTNCLLLNCIVKSSKLDLGQDCHLNDLRWVRIFILVRNQFGSLDSHY